MSVIRHVWLTGRWCLQRRNIRALLSRQRVCRNLRRSELTRRGMLRRLRLVRRLRRMLLMMDYTRSVVLIQVWILRLLLVLLQLRRRKSGLVRAMLLEDDVSRYARCQLSK